MQGKYDRAMDRWTPLTQVSSPQVNLRGLYQPQLRADGTPKGMGWLGVQQNQLGQDVTEYSIGVNLGEEETQIPTMTPNMNKYDMTNILDSSAGLSSLSPEVQRKAIEHARMKLIQSLSPYKISEEYSR